MNDRIFKMGKLVLWGVSLWVFFAVITPRLVALSPAWQHYDRVQEENGLDSGACITPMSLWYSPLRKP